jgi:hypothetical protein
MRSAGAFVVSCLVGLCVVWSLVGGLRPVEAQQLGGMPQVCTVFNTSTTTLVAFVGAGCVGREAQTAFYITSITAGATVISSATTDEQLELKYGTGTNCGTGTTALWSAYNLANTSVVPTFPTPLKVPGGKDLCWMDAGTGSKTFVVAGYLGAQ